LVILLQNGRSKSTGQLMTGSIATDLNYFIL
jgi:hypothetical protein